MRITSGGRYTIDGRWVVVGSMFEDGPEVILFDPHNADFYPTDPDPMIQLLDIRDCQQWIKELDKQETIC